MKLSTLIILIIPIFAFAQNKSNVNKIVFDHSFEGNMRVVQNTPDTDVIIEIKNDSIWRFVIENGKQIGDFNRVEKGNGVLNSHAKIDKSIIYQKINLFDTSDIYVVKKNLEDRKTILGFECYKVQLERKIYEEELQTHLSTYYDMYVTNEIDLPMHAVVNITNEFADFFPLEIKIWQPAFDFVIENYVAIEIK